MTQTKRRLKGQGNAIKVKSRYGLLAVVEPWKCPGCNIQTALTECLRCKAECNKESHRSIVRFLDSETRHSHA